MTPLHHQEKLWKLVALRTASHNVLMNGYDPPFYWASFVLAGES